MHVPPLRPFAALVLALGIAATARAVEGDLDLSFNSTGKARVAYDLGGTEAGKADHLVDIVMQPDGKVLLLGSVNDDDDFTRVGIARLRVNGTPDPAFDTDGKLDFAAGVSVPQALAVLDSGRIVVALRSEFSGVLLARRAADGSADGYPGQSFGLIVFQLPGATTNNVTALHPLPGGRLLVAGIYTSGAQGSDFFVARLDANGVLDPTFGSAGFTRVNFALDIASADAAHALAVAPDGRIAAVGTVSAGDNEFGIVMLDANGQPIQNFDADGRAVIDFDIGQVSNDRGGGACFVPDGRLVVGGNVTDVDGPDTLGLAQVNAFGALAPAFSGGGRRVVGLLSFGGLSCTRDAKLLVTGTIDTSTPTLAPSEAYVLRYDANGENDGSFAGFGSIVGVGLNVGGASGGRIDTGIAVTLDPKGRIYAGFDAQFGGADFDYAVARLQTAFLFADGFE